MATQFGTFDDLLEITAEPMKAIVVALREVVLEIDPDAVEVVRLGDRAATYGVGPKKMIEGYTYVLPYKKHVNLGFFRGVGLDDPDGRLEGTGAKMRHVKVRSLEEARDPALQALIRAALKERRAALG